MNTLTPHEALRCLERRADGATAAVMLGLLLQCFEVTGVDLRPAEAMVAIGIAFDMESDAGSERAEASVTIPLGPWSRRDALYRPIRLASPIGDVETRARGGPYGDPAA